MNPEDLDHELPLRAGTSAGEELTALMLAAKTGASESFDQLSLRVRGRAFRVAHSMVGSRDDALELVQEALLKTWRARDTFREGEPFLPWFHRILRNSCFSFLRKHGRLRAASLSAHKAGHDDQGDWEIADPAEPEESALEVAERTDALQRALAGLAPRDREILALRHFEELAYQEIADTLQIPIGTVMSRLFHARRRLRDRLEPELRDAGGP
jgi:RNA polymerase sigma-70 factor (ECF subfamily)